MGNFFPAIKSLKEVPHLRSVTLKLVEKSFEYQAPYSFERDFAPLFSLENAENCFVLVSEKDEVLAHIAFREREIKLGAESHKVGMIGGIAVQESERGKGHFQILMAHVLTEKKDEVAFFLLWSDQAKLYQKFGFHLCGIQFELAQDGEATKSFEETTFVKLSKEERAQVRLLFEKSFATEHVTLARKESDWENIARITESRLFLRRTAGIITDYFFLGKGQDLTGIIHEYGSSRPLADYREEMRAWGKVWGSTPPGQEQYQFMIAPGETPLLTRFLLAYTNGQIVLRAVQQMKDEVFFDFADETLVLPVEEFFRGLLGPGTFEELGELRPLFFSGLDSV